jgi:tetratricopeptide (TPR) repeat protein
LQKAEAAVPELRRLLRLDPCNRDALGMLFDALIRLGRADDAMHEFLSEIQRNPECAVAWYFKGSLLLNQGDHPAAIEALNTSTRIDPKNGDAWVTLMNAHRLQGNYGAAGLACAEASKLDNLSGFALGWLGIYNAEIGEFARASENLRRAVADDEKQSWLWASLGWALQYRGDADCGAASLEAYRKGLSVCQEIAGTTDEVWLHKGLADALFLDGQPDKATKEFKNIAEICSGRRDHNELYILAWSYYRLRRYDEAAFLLESVTSAGNDRYFAQFDHALVVLAMGLVDRAHAEYEQVVRNIASVDILRRCGLLYVALFDILEASLRQVVSAPAQPIVDDMYRWLADAGLDVAEFHWYKTRLGALNAANPEPRK